ncbi:UDP-glycosyltransferase 89A2-like [Mangifera indica]|uniref:UDP-glycosyltransferase 89A2-like n=1 Tax=Mangifera indica TaxID=29780 RepID=UPI001CFAD039|nr:UDP-glycosyltransferase 89A2-like [Mangifera indica]
MSRDNSAGAHILVFPYPAQGHMLPVLDLTHQLALRNLTITIVITPRNLPCLTPLLTAHPDIQTLVLPFPFHPSIPDGVENVKDLGCTGNVPIMNALGNLFDPVSHWFHSHPNPPVAILSDFFLGWTLRLAYHLNIVRIAFFSSGSFLASVFEYIWYHLDEIKSGSAIQLHKLPGSPILSEEHLPTAVRLYKRDDPQMEFVKEGLVANFSSWGCVFNSSEALEGVYLDYLKTTMGNDRVFGVGPLSLVGLNLTNRKDPGFDPSDSVFEWLDKCPDGSVLYVCFGSQKALNKEQMEALATGIERSGIRFLWVVKTGFTGQADGKYGLIPDGFEERVADRGLILKGWVPQVAILNHKAVGGFLSHCGWNSTLEAIVGGVMILAWPMEADQFVNAKLLVDDMGVAVRVCEGAESVPDSAELGGIISESFSEVGQVKIKAKELKEKALAAVESGGSSYRELDRLVQELTGLQHVE